MKRTLSALAISSLPLLWTAACSSNAETGENPSDPPVENDGMLDMAVPADNAVVQPGDCRPTVEAKLSAPLAELRSSTPFDIELNLADGAPISESAPHPIKVVLTKSDGTVVKTLLDEPKPLGKLALSFTPGLEKNLPTGALKLSAELGCPVGTQGQPSRTTATVYLVRVGATKLFVKNGDGGGRVPLLYHAVDHTAGNYFPVADSLATTSFEIPKGESELDKIDGTPRRFADKPWNDLETPPVDGTGAVLETGNTLPVSLVIGTKPDLVWSIGKTAQGPLMGATQPTGLGVAGLPAIRLVVDGIAGSDMTLIQEGGEVTVRLDKSPVPAIDRVETTLNWHFEWKGEDGNYHKLAGGEQEVLLRFYGVLGNEQGTAAPDLPWVAVVDEATRKIAGAATDAKDARAILTQYVFEEMGLSYDRRSGASKYTSYSGSGGWSVGSFSLAAFLLRARGKIVNCSDCASILSTYTNMIGAKLHYAIIGWNFKLNPILGIGATMFGSPFDSGRLQFSYHAVTTHDSTMTINDATLAVDGDMDPKVAPQVKQLVQNLTGDDYLTRLSPTFGTGTPVYQYDDQITHAR